MSLPSTAFFVRKEQFSEKIKLGSFRVDSSYIKRIFKNTEQRNNVQL